MFTESSTRPCYKNTVVIGVPIGVVSMEMKEAFSTNLEDWLFSTGRKKSWLATQLGVANSSVTGWVEGRTMPAKEEHFCRIATLMNLPHVSLLFVKGSIHSPIEAIEGLASMVRDS